MMLKKVMQLGRTKASLFQSIKDDESLVLFFNEFVSGVCCLHMVTMMVIMVVIVVTMSMS